MFTKGQVNIPFGVCLFDFLFLPRRGKQQKKSVKLRELKKNKNENKHFTVGLTEIWV